MIWRTGWEAESLRRPSTFIALPFPVPFAAPTITDHKPTAMHVAFLTDQKYVQLTAVAAMSLLESHLQSRSKTGQPPHLHIHMVCIEVDAEGKSLLQSIVSAFAGADACVTVHCVDHSLPPGLQGRERWLQLVSLKLHLAQILAQLERVIFLDSDIVVVGDLLPLWRIDLQGHWLATTPCLLDHPGNLANYNIFPLRYQDAGEPINAGVLVMDLALMRTQRVAERLTQWQQAHQGRLKLPEQEAIALNYRRQWLALGHEWNFRPYGEPYWTAASWPQLREYFGLQPVIVHFQGNVRPFDMAINLPYYPVWLRNYRQLLALSQPSGSGAMLAEPERKPLGYAQFVFFEYPDLLCRSSNWLPGGLIRFGLMGSLLALLALPRALPAWLRYRRAPAAYKLRIFQWLAADTQQTNH